MEETNDNKRTSDDSPQFTPMKRVKTESNNEETTVNAIGK